jgi:hypothetical protein
MATASLLLVLCVAQAGGAPAAPAKAEKPDDSEAATEAAAPKKPAEDKAAPTTILDKTKAQKTDISNQHVATGLSQAPPLTAAQLAARPVLEATEGTERIIRALFARDIETLVTLTPAPFSFDGVVAKTPAEVRQHWAETLDRHPVERLRLYGVEELPYPEMVKKYGPPPARLSSVNLSDARLGVANLNGRATIVAWKRRNGRLTAVAISD